MEFSVTIILPSEIEDNGFVYYPPKPIELSSGKWVCAITDYVFNPVFGTKKTLELDSVTLGEELNNLSNNLTEFAGYVLRNMINPQLYDTEYVRNTLLHKYPNKSIDEVIKEIYKKPAPLLDGKNKQPLTVITNKVTDVDSYANNLLKTLLKPPHYVLEVNKTYTLAELFFTIMGQHLVFLEKEAETKVTNKKDVEKFVKYNLNNMYLFLKNGFKTEGKKFLRENPHIQETLIFVKTDFTAPVIVDNKIDRTILITTSRRPKEVPPFKAPMYVPVVKDFINSIRIEITDYDKYPIVFKPEKKKSSYITLSFKKLNN